MKSLATLCMLCIGLLALTVSGKKAQYSAIPNGQQYLDTGGNPIDAHGPGFLKVDNTWYWVGQSFYTAPAGAPPNEAMVNLYKSTDLLNWDFVGPIVTAYTPGVNGSLPFAYSFPGRPKLLYNKPTKKYVLWVHWEEIATFGASEVIVLTADNVAGPYRVTSKSHRRPGAGNNSPDAMGDRIGSLVLDYNTQSKNTSDTSHPYVPVQAAYPPQIYQFNAPNPKNLTQVSYVSQSNGYGTSEVDNAWTFQFGNIQFNFTLKALAVRMTPWNATLYNLYETQYSLGVSSYIVRYPTTNRSQVSSAVYELGNPGTARTSLVPPVIGPTLNESKSNEVVWVNSGDAAFITVGTDGASIFYTTDGSTPSSTSSQYWDGTRITIAGAPGTNLTVKAISVLNNQTSSVVSQTYEIASDSSLVPVFNPIINRPSGVYRRGSPEFGWEALRVYCPSYNTVCYYTMDGLDPNPPMEGDNNGYGSHDMTVWVDPKTDIGYFMTASDNIYGRIWQLTEDYTDVVAELEFDVWVDKSHEAPAMIRNVESTGEWVYLVNSQQSGWFANQAQYLRTNNLAGGFKLPRDNTGYRDGSSLWSPFQPLGDSSTFNSQSSYILNIGTDAKPVYIFMGDRNDASYLYDSTYVFLPLTVNDTGASEDGSVASGEITLNFTPELEVNLAKHSIIPPTWKLLSLNQPVVASPSVALTPEQEAAGTYNYSASVANDGVDFDLNIYGPVQQYYKPQSVPFFWQVDLGKSYNLAWIGLSFLSYGGSDAANQYTILASNDAQSWVKLIDNSQNQLPGYQSHILSGAYRYVQVDDINIYDVDHGKGADWEAGVFEISVYGSSHH